ncbi:MAG: hypothetical protein NZ585_07995 [Chloracidobacterium sp.]|nr:hypothetical protein [Chloracidobacterium sp.]MDW8218048.1 hypothetical protein [Acidobacteriota bacterium]
MENQDKPAIPTPSDAQGRRPYTKPAIVRVELRAEEAVLGACKTMTTAGPASPQCGALGCSAIAS